MAKKAPVVVEGNDDSQDGEEAPVVVEGNDDNSGQEAPVEVVNNTDEGERSTTKGKTSPLVKPLKLVDEPRTQRSTLRTPTTKTTTQVTASEASGPKDQP